MFYTSKSKVFDSQFEQMQRDMSGLWFEQMQRHMSGLRFEQMQRDMSGFWAR